MSHPTRRQALGSLAGLALAPAGLARAQADWPGRPIKIIVGYAPGGPSDVTARLLLPKLTAALGQPVVVENRPGAGSNIAFDALAAAPPDGYTLMLTTIVMVLNPYLYKTRWTLAGSFQPIVNCMSAPSVLAVSAALPVKNLADFIALAKREPGRHSFASTGNGGSAHLAGEMLQRQAGIRLIHVPYKGTSPAISDILGGMVDSGFLTAMGSVPHLRKGNPRPIAVAAKSRHPQLPDVPTFAEQGYPDMIVESWNGLVAPAGVPQAIVERLNAEANKALESPDVRQNFVSMGGQVVGGSVPAFKAYIDEESTRWGALIQAADVHLE